MGHDPLNINDLKQKEPH